MVLSQEEVSRFFDNLHNLKHRALIMTAYAAGTRVSEVVSLRAADIDSDRMMIRVELGKGRKDRLWAAAHERSLCFRPKTGLLSVALNASAACSQSSVRTRTAQTTSVVVQGQVGDSDQTGEKRSRRGHECHISFECFRWGTSDASGRLRQPRNPVMNAIMSPDL